VTGYLVDAAAVEPRRDEGDTAETRVAIDASAGCERLEQSVVRYAPGRSRERTLAGRQEVLYVQSGAGTLHLNGAAHALEPQMGVFLVPGDEVAVENPGPEELVVVAVTAPEDASAADPRRRTVRYEDQPVLPASPNREFRYLVNQDVGCLDVTQFVGLIPPGRAPLHSHTYDEVVYVLEGEGRLHIGDTTRPLRAGSCVHLPPLELHSIENTGATPIKVLGVFHPSGDPASRAKEAGT
jgi:mannose-6-phosphate isomerase-like protein (cupin superfamily)